MSLVTKLGYKMAKVLWKITKPVTLGARVIMIRENKVLLVKHTYQDSWYLPGGGVKKGETYTQAIQREVNEEVGGNLIDYKLFGVYNNFFENKNDSVVIFYSDNFTLTGKGDKEIENYKFFYINDLPSSTSRGTKIRIKEYIEGESACVGVW